MVFNKEIIQGFWTSFKRPLAIVLESSNQCNANCTMCPREDLPRKQEIMDLDLFKKIILDAKNIGVDIFQLSFFGEALLDPNLVVKIKHIFNLIPEAWVQIVTNGDLLTNEKSKDLLEAGISEIRVSIEGNNTEEFNRIRDGLDYNKIIDNLRYLKRTRDNNKHFNTQIVVTGLHLKTVPLNIKEYKNFWSKYADIVYTRNEYELNLNIKEGIVSKLLPCDFLLKHLPILADGSYTLCIYDWYGKTIYGNLKDKSIREAWFSPKIIFYKIMHLIGLKRRLNLCDDCAYRTNYKKIIE